MAKKPGQKNNNLPLKGENYKILLVGGGKMGQALLCGWLENGFKRNNILVVEPNRIIRDRIKKSHKIACTNKSSEVDSFPPDVIFFAVKPGDMAGVLPYYQKFENALFISIAAGITIDFLKKHLGEKKKVVRAMPNLPATIGQGATAISYAASIGTKNSNIAIRLFGAVGYVCRAPENYMDLVTAISGSGPAYVFYLAECLIEAAVSFGMEKEIAESLVLQTLKGSAIMAFDSENPVGILRENVTSPGGTTEAAFGVLYEDNFKSIVKQAVEAAKTRAEELSK